MNRSVLFLVLAGALGLSGTVRADAVCREAATVADAAPSLLPEGHDFRLVWHDEFDGERLDETKWNFRTNFWGRRADWFAAPEDGAVTLSNGVVRLGIVRTADGTFRSAQLQTAGALWDDLKPGTGHGIVWPFAPRQKPKFTHRYGYYECRAKLQRHAGWWSAFWMQALANGATLDPRRSGVECDIMESFDPGRYIVHAFHYNGCGPEYKRFNAQRAPYTPTPDSAWKVNYPITLDAFHVFGLLWEPDGYTVFVDGKQSGYKVGKVGDEVVSETEEFILVSTELKGFRKDGKPVPEVEAAWRAGDAFEVDFVRVYDIVR